MTNTNNTQNQTTTHHLNHLKRLHNITQQLDQNLNHHAQTILNHHLPHITTPLLNNNPKQTLTALTNTAQDLRTHAERLAAGLHTPHPNETINKQHIQNCIQGLRDYTAQLTLENKNTPTT